METYDEDLTANSWYISLCRNHEDLFARATSERWMICIPKNGTWKPIIDDGDLFSQKYFESHILKPLVVYSNESEGESQTENKYITFNGKEVFIEGSKVLCGNGFSNKFQKPSYDSRSETLDLQVESCHSSEILFEETFFNQNDESYVVLCISQPLETDVVLQKKSTDLDIDNDDVDVTPAKSLWDSYGTFIWGKASNPTKCRSFVNEKIAQFITEQSNSPYSFTLMAKNEKAREKQVQCIKESMLKLFTTCYQQLLKDPKLKKFCENPVHCDEFCTTLENYMQHDVHDALMGNLKNLLSFQDFHLNKITRNLLPIRLEDLEIQERFGSGILRARRELSLLNQFHTPREKLACIQKAVAFLTQRNATYSYAGSVSGISSENRPEPQVMSSDDLLPILVFLIIKCDVANWMANLYYLKYFQINKSSQDKLGFYLATLEAAIEHVKRGNVNIDVAKVLSLQKKNTSENLKQLTELFTLIREGDASGVQRVLRQAESLRNLHEHDKCHPLCECQKCKKLTQGNYGGESKSLVGASSRDDRGRAALHVVSISGRHEMVDILVEYGADLNATDYHGCTPLHLAAAEGSQSVMFLLLHHGANANAEDNNNNTALHLASLGGHEGCVKALLYFDPISVIVKVNSKNDSGDTPLHIASRWGYVQIVQALMEYSGDPHLKNRKHLTPFDVSHNSDVTNTLRTTEVDPSTVSRYRDQPKKKSLQRSFTLATASVGSQRGGGSKAKKKNKGQDENVNTAKEIEKLLRAVRDNDVSMVSFLCGWPLPAKPEEVTTAQKCHPLCQCSKCKPPLTESILHANSTGPDGSTPLLIAAKLGYVDMIEHLLRHNAKTDHKMRVKGHTPLHVACQYDHVKIVKMLLNHGAYYDIRDSEGNTPIFMASMNGHQKAITVLLEHKASVNIRNHRGDSPLHEAVKWRHSDTVRLLLDGGAKVYYENNLGKTPLDLAAAEPEILTILKSELQAQTPEPSSGTHMTSVSSNEMTSDSRSCKSISQSEADEALADDLYDKFNDRTPSTPPLYDVDLKGSIASEPETDITKETFVTSCDNTSQERDENNSSNLLQCVTVKTSEVDLQGETSSPVTSQVLLTEDCHVRLAEAERSSSDNTAEAETSAKPFNVDTYFEIATKLTADVINQVNEETSHGDVTNDVGNTGELEPKSNGSYLSLNNNEAD